MTPRTATERLEEVEALLDDLREDNDGVPVLVEGEKDVAALRALGLRGEILRLKGADTVWVTCETYARRHRRIILLVDWDRGGGHLARLAIEALEANGVRVDRDYRRALARATKKEIVQVEAIGRYLANLEHAARQEAGRSPNV